MAAGTPEAVTGAAAPAGSAAWRVYEKLRQDIIDLDLPPDATLARGELAARFGVSQTPIREAMQLLEQDGLVRIYPQSRTVVTRINERELHETHFLRVAVETEVVRRLARMPGAEAVGRARAILGMQAALAPDPAQTEIFGDLDRAFHRALFEGVGMASLHALLERRLGHLARCQRLDLPTEGKTATIVAFHGAILERIGAGDPDGAAGAMHAHLSGTIGRIGALKAEFPDYFTREGR